ncbi:MAG: NADH-quinone oxidoreductase subunit C [Planctomycetota bacterium]
MNAEEAAKAVVSRFQSKGAESSEFRGEYTVVLPSAATREALKYCKEELAFDYLVDISSLDHFETDPRFEMVYELYSYSSGAHLRIRCPLDEEDDMDSVVDIWPTADWHEREVYDMMGIKFANHPDLRRILMWEGYPYYPLRKDFPLAGRESDMPDVAFSDTAPLEGGPFVTSPTDATTEHREPRSREFE